MKSRYNLHRFGFASLTLERNRNTSRDSLETDSNRKRKWPKTVLAKDSFITGTEDEGGVYCLSCHLRVPNSAEGPSCAPEQEIELRSSSGWLFSKNKKKSLPKSGTRTLSNNTSYKTNLRRG